MSFVVGLIYIALIAGALFLANEVWKTCRNYVERGIGPRTPVCWRCGRNGGSREDYVRNREGPHDPGRGLEWLCRKCSTERSRLFRALPAPERIAVSEPSSRNPLPDDVQRSLVRQSLGVCPYCRVTIVRGEFDHIIPLSRSGAYTEDNILWCCRKCNRKKGDRTAKEYMRLQGKTWHGKPGARAVGLTARQAHDYRRRVVPITRNQVILIERLCVEDWEDIPEGLEGWSMSDASEFIKDRLAEGPMQDSPITSQQMSQIRELCQRAGKRPPVFLDSYSKEKAHLLINRADYWVDPPADQMEMPR